MYFFAMQHRMTHMAKDAELFTIVLKDLRHMEVHQLRIENIDFLLRAFSHSTEKEFRYQLGDKLESYTKDIEEFLPRLIE